MKKQFKLQPEEFVQLIEPIGSCLASDRITVGGEKVGYMYREEPNDESDGGWRFFAGDESEQYSDDPNNFEIYDVNTIANYDRAIIPYLSFEAGSQLERVAGTDSFEANA